MFFMCEVQIVKTHSIYFFKFDQSAVDFVPIHGKFGITFLANWGPGLTVSYPLPCYTKPHYNGGRLYIFDDK